MTFVGDVTLGASSGPPWMRWYPKQKWIFAALQVAVMCLVGALVPAGGQTKPLMAEDAFKNVQLLKGIPVDEFMNTMGFFAASLSLNCTSCHGLESAGDVARFADDTPLKQSARKMILMVKTINGANFGGKPMVTCYTCHRGTEKPEITPSLAEQYGSPPPDDPDKIEIVEQEQAVPSASQVLDKYIQVLGGERLAGLKSFVGKGTYQGYDTDREKVPVELFAKAPDQRGTVVHLPGGDKIMTYDGRSGWIAEPDTPAPLTALTGGNLDGARIDAMLLFPTRIKQSRSQWRAGKSAIDDREVTMVEGTDAHELPLKLYFDQKSGFLVRMVRYANTVIGPVSTQVDYSDYRAVLGVMLPFKWTVTWVDGQSTTELSEVEPNPPIDPGRFAKPAVPGIPSQ